MKISWFIAIPVIALAAGATTFWSDTKSALSVSGILLFAWWIAYTYSDSPMDRAYNEYLHCDEEMRKEFMESASPKMRAEIEKRVKAEEPISSQSQRPDCRPAVAHRDRSAK